MESITNTGELKGSLKNSFTLYTQPRHLKF